jgi:DnaD/phage-associated family protein
VREQKEAELAKVIAYYSQVIVMDPAMSLADKNPPERVVKALKSYLENSDEELVIHAFDIAADTDKRAWAYVEGILENWKANCIFTMQDYDIHERNRKAEKSARRSGGF